MRKIIFILVLPFSAAEAQESVNSPLILRSTISTSAPLPNEQSPYILQQSAGQSGVIGSYESGGHTISQGFIQTITLSNMVNPSVAIDLKAQVFPNPFVDRVHVSFLESIDQPVDVFVFSDMRRKISSVSYHACQELTVNFQELPPGTYFIKIVTKDKQYVCQSVKL